MTVIRDEDAKGAESLDISLEKLAAIVLKARAFDAQAGVSDPDEGSNESDDRMVSVLEGQADDPTVEELRAFLVGLTADEQAALVALAWVGRGDFTADEWEDAKKLARERHKGSTARYLMGMPLLGDYLEEGAATLGYNLTLEEFDAIYHAGGGETGRT
jgi:hypothetical protein